MPAKASVKAHVKAPAKAPLKASKPSKAKPKSKSAVTARSRSAPQVQPVAPPVPDNKAIYLRFIEEVLNGGNFSVGKYVTLREPLGFVVLDRADGKSLYHFDQAMAGITNMVIVP